MGNDAADRDLGVSRSFWAHTGRQDQVISTQRESIWAYDPTARLGSEDDESMVITDSTVNHDRTVSLHISVYLGGTVDTSFYLLARQIDIALVEAIRHRCYRVWFCSFSISML